MAMPFLGFSESGALGGHSPEDLGGIALPCLRDVGVPLPAPPRDVQHNLPLCVGFDRKRPFQGTFGFGSNTMVSQRQEELMPGFLPGLGVEIQRTNPSRLHLAASPTWSGVGAALFFLGSSSPSHRLPLTPHLGHKLEQLWVILAGIFHLILALISQVRKLKLREPCSFKVTQLVC